MSEYETALRRIEERAINTCPGCGKANAKWKDPTVVALAEINGGKIADQGPEAFAYACEWCGYIRLHAVEMFDWQRRSFLRVFGSLGSTCRPLFGMTSQGSAHGRFTRAIQTRNLWAAEYSMRALGTPSLEDALSYLGLLAELKPEKLERACVRWHGRLETEATFLSLAESQLALAALASLCAGEREAVEVLRRLLRRVRPTVVSSVT